MKSRRELALDGLFAVVWATFAAIYCGQSIETISLFKLGLLIYYTLIAALFVFRRPIQTRCAWWETVIAVIAAFLPIIVLKDSGGGFTAPGLALMLVALLGMIVAAGNLGRSLAIAPGDRGLVTRGLYRWVRHPLYATELLFYIGWLIAHPAWRNIFGLIASIALLAIRILREERIISDYHNYAQQVRWRLAPGIW